MPSDNEKLLANRQRCRDWYAKNKERRKEYNRIWETTHKGWRAEWYQNNKAERRAKQRTWRGQNQTKVRAYHLRRRFGMTETQYRARLIVQAGTCACCAGKFEGTPDVDHDHQTGAIRGLVCRRCNMAIASAERPQLAEMALAYLAAWGSNG